MGAEVLNKIKDCEFHGDYVGRDQITTNIILFQDNEREFVVTHNADIKPVSYFTGRETELQDLRRRIEEGRKSVLVSGMGGIGKTHICRKLFEEYLNKHADNQDNFFRHIGYIEYSVDIGSSLLSCLKYKEQKRVEDNQEAAWRELEYLASDGRLLLFVDNVNVSMGDDPGLKRLMGIPGAIVLTSRRRVFSREFEPYRIGFLSTEKCREIYEKIRFEDSGKRIERYEEPDLEYIINTLAARHTITVEFLAHLAWTKNWTVKKLREELESNGFQLEYRDEEDKLINIQKSYETLYDLSVLTAAEQNILEAFSMFPYIPLDVETCNLWLLEDAGVSEDDDILNMLYRKGWLQYDVEMNGYSMHPVFAQFIYEKTKPRKEMHCDLIYECKLSMRIPEDGVVLKCRKYIPFAENIAEKTKFEDDVEKMAFLYMLANLLQYAAEYQRAERWYKTLLKALKEMGYRNSFVTAAIYSDLAGIYESLGKYKRAKNIYEKALEILENLPQKDFGSIALNYNNLAGVYADQGEYRKSRELYEKALTILISIHGENHLDNVRCYNNLARLYKLQGEWERAEKLLIKSVMILERVDKANPVDKANCYNHLAGIYVHLGKCGEAEKMCMKGLKIRRETLGEFHSDTATSYVNLAKLYEVRGEYEKAEELYKKSIEIWEGLSKVHNADTVTGYSDLACMYMEIGKYAEAKELLKKSTGIYEHAYGEDNWQTVVFYVQLAKVYIICEEYCNALTYYFKAYRAVNLVRGSKHPNTKILYDNMKEVYIKCYPQHDLEQWLKEKMKE